MSSLSMSTANENQVSEGTSLFKSISSAHLHDLVTTNDNVSILNQNWSGTPGIRQNWFNKSTSSIADFVNVKKTVTTTSTAKFFPIDADESSVNTNQSDSDKPVSLAVANLFTASTFYKIAHGTPGLLIGVILNLFLSTSFGLAMFPGEWEFPEHIPRAIGVQMFLFATIICQIVLTALSKFKAPVGMMMVENIPFMHVISRICIQHQGFGRESFSSLFVTLAIASFIVGVFFYALGHFKLGNIVHFFPKYVIVGCIGGIGIFIFQTGLEVATNSTWYWSFESLQLFLSSKIVFLWLISLAFELFLRFLQHLTKLSILPPFYFISIPPVFYAVLYFLSIPIETAHSHGYFFEKVVTVNPLLIWELIDFTTVDWSVVGESIPTIVALTIFSLMHVPINIPSLSLTTKENVDMNNELIAHGVSNMISGLTGGLQNYLCYSNSLLYFKCNGSGQVSGYLLAVVTSIFFIIGPSLVYYIPRCMISCFIVFSSDEFLL